MDTKIKRNEFLGLSLKNSNIRNFKQHFISDIHSTLKIPILLGVNTSAPTLQEDLFKQSNFCKNESILDNIEKDISVNSKNNFKVKGFSFIENKITGFSSYK